MAPQRQRWTPELNEDVTTEILLRIPPDDPAHLFRASVVCKLWLRVVSDPSFLRRYGAFHRGAPLLGFFYNLFSSLRPFPGFVPTTVASSPPQPVGHGSWARWALDCRHGRVLLGDIGSGNFVVWDPFSNHWDELLAPWEELQAPRNWYRSHNSRSSAVVLCAVAACDHRSCRGGPFHVVCVGVYRYSVLLAHVYSSESRTWSTPASAQLDGTSYFDSMRAALIGDGIYFSVNHGARIVKYDFVKHRLSTMSVPVWQHQYRKAPVLMQNEDGSLGIAGVLGSRLYLWSTMVNAEGVTGWVERRVIKLEEILSVDITSVQANVISFAEDVEVFFISTNVGAFTLELKSGRVRKVSEPRDYIAVTPFISFFTPDRGRSKWTK